MWDDLLVLGLRTAMLLPDVLVRPLGWGPLTDDGHPLSPRLRWFLRLLRLDPRDEAHLSPAQERAAYHRLSCSSASGPVVDVRVEDHTIPVPIRVYTPPTAAPAPRPLLFWMHGGGWVIGSLDTHDRFCRRLCRELDAVVVAVGYRLAPEHPFPAPLEDVTAAWQWIRAHAIDRLGADPERLLMGGDSAGGNMTAVLCQQLPPEARPALQVLCYPGTDFHAQAPSRHRLGEGFFMSEGMVGWFLDHYSGGADRSDPRISPLRAPVLGDDQPPALVITAGLDPLLDEGRAYAARLEAAGVPVERLHIPAMVHGFVTLYGLLPEADTAVAEMIRRIRCWLSPEAEAEAAGV